MEKSRRQRLQHSLAVLAVSLFLLAVAASGKPGKLSEKSKSSLVPSPKDEEVQLTTG